MKVVRVFILFLYSFLAFLIKPNEFVDYNFNSFQSNDYTVFEYSESNLISSQNNENK